MKNNYEAELFINNHVFAKLFWFNVYLIIHFLRIKNPNLTLNKLIISEKSHFFFKFFLRIIIDDKLSNYQKRKTMFGKYFWVC